MPFTPTPSWAGRDDAERGSKQSINARAVTMPMAHIARAIEWGHDLGFYRMVVDNNTDKILGATLVGCRPVLHVFFISDGSRGDLAVAGAVCAYPSHLWGGTASWHGC